MTPLPADLRNAIVCADVFDYLLRLPEDCVHTCITSPPYFRLRDYKVAGQIGLEETVDDYVAMMVEVFREVRRVLRDDGTLWLNLGDSFANDAKWRGSAGGKRAKALHGADATRDRARSGFARKQLLMIPHRVALALQADGWIVRSDIVWSKPSPMPESVKDRPSRAHEYVFLLSKRPDYYYDIDATRRTHSPATTQRYRRGYFAERDRGHVDGRADNSVRWMNDPEAKAEAIARGANITDVWTVNPTRFAEAHFATFPAKLIRPAILAGCPSQCCAVCGAPYRRLTERQFIPQADVSAERVAYRGKVAEGKWQGYPRGSIVIRTTGFEPTCTCRAGTTPGIVLDPFMGAATTAHEALRLQRDFAGCELNPVYVEMGLRRISGLLSQMRLF
ncbi:MAG: site-specific DNA-methyltransferase [Anaerolineae bacterium]|nr:site-specific DNA-methyltransferase [Anaerolineae bacterium]NUQ05952.1 site-specific DNA-methyltransferase [Anaerolineae bacterium]